MKGVMLAVPGEEAPEEDAQEEAQEASEAHPAPAPEAGQVARSLGVRTPTVGASSRPSPSWLARLAACGAGKPSGRRRVRRSSRSSPRDGVTLDGRLFGSRQGERRRRARAHVPRRPERLVLLRRPIGRLGYRVLTFDFRGYCPGGDAGCSEGEKNIPAIWQDVEGAVAALRSKGVTRLALVGASMGGTASLIVGREGGSGNRRRDHAVGASRRSRVSTRDPTSSLRCTPRSSSSPATGTPPRPRPWMRFYDRACSPSVP